jgi:undecaprenyl-diphosphatase
MGRGKPIGRLYIQISLLSNLVYNLPMNYLTSGLLGILQGLTEFLPVSSSGHLILVQSLLPSFSQPGVLFDVTLHFGTMFAVLIFFGKKLIPLIKKYFIPLVIGTIPAVLIGFFFKDQLEGLFSSVKVVGVGLIISGILNYLTHMAKEKGILINLKNSFLIGLAQAVAIVPGISRSGATIFAGTNLGIKAKEVAEFSFLLSIPAILGANLLEIIGNYNQPVNIGVYSVGFIFAFMAGIASIFLVLKLLKEKNFKYFAFYCFFVGLVTLFL